LFAVLSKSARSASLFLPDKIWPNFVVVKRWIGTLLWTHISLFLFLTGIRPIWYLCPIMKTTEVGNALECGNSISDGGWYSTVVAQVHNAAHGPVDSEGDAVLVLPNVGSTWASRPVPRAALEKL
jgi:hypothetical protein